MSPQNIRVETGAGGVNAYPGGIVVNGEVADTPCSRRLESNRHESPGRSGRGLSRRRGGLLGLRFMHEGLARRNHVGMPDEFTPDLPNRYGLLKSVPRGEVALLPLQR